MPNKCILCGLYPADISESFPNGTKMKQVTSEDVDLWSVELEHMLEVGQRVCCRHFTKSGYPDKSTIQQASVVPQMVRRTRRRGALFRYGAGVVPYTPTKRELGLAQVASKLHHQLLDMEKEKKLHKRKYDDLRQSMQDFVEGASGKILVDWETYNLLKEFYWHSLNNPHPFNIRLYATKPGSIRHFTSAPCYAEFVKGVQACEPYYDCPSDALDILNAFAAMLMKARTNLSYEFLADMFLLSPSALRKIILYTLSVFVEVLGRKYLKLPTLQELLQHQVINSKDPESHLRIGGIDQTYLYLQHSSDYYIQTETFSGHHYVNELQFVEYVAPDGCVLAIDGPYSVQSDSWHLQAWIDSDYYGENVGKWFENIGTQLPGAIMEFDRGFPIVEHQFPPEIDVRRPAYLRTRPHFTREEALSSEKSASARASVEQLNSRLNIQHIICNTYPNIAIPYAAQWMYAAAIISRLWYKPFYPSAHTAQPVNPQINQQPTNQQTSQQQTNQQTNIQQQSTTNNATTTNQQQ